MALGTWWVGDPLPDLPPLSAFSISLSTDIQRIASLTKLAHREIEARWRNGNYLYLAFLEETPVAYGWVATKKAGVREIGLAFTLPPHNRYLWDFQTFPAWRGQGIYGHFLQEIVRTEFYLVDRFWILYEPNNDAAARAISKAGFVFVGELALTQGRVSGIQIFIEGERASAGADLLNLPIVTEREM